MAAGNRGLLETRDLCRTYWQGKVQVPALREVNLVIEPGEFTAVVGPSGSGKSTLLNLLGGLDRPTSGDIFFEGRSLTAMNRGDLSRVRRDRMGFVFQSFQLIPVFSALENAEFVLDLQGVPAAERKRRAMQVLSDVGLEDLAHRRPDELSGGQQQRVAVARAIASEPAVVLADEPTANLDSHTATALLELMRGLNEKKNITFLFSTHDQKVMDRARRVIRLEDGAVVSDERVHGESSQYE